MSYDKKSHDNIAAEHPEFCSSFMSRSNVLLSGPLPLVGIAMTHGETSKGICEHCKKQVVVYPGQAWHGKDDKVWHELCSYQAEIGRLAAAFESLKELRISHCDWAGYLVHKEDPTHTFKEFDKHCPKCVIDKILAMPPIL